MGKQWTQCQTLFFWAPESLQMVNAAMKLKDTTFGRKVMINLDSILKSRDISLPTTFANKVPSSQGYGFSSSHVWMWELDCEESRRRCCCCVISVVSDSVRPHRWHPTRLPRPWDSPGKNTGVGCHFLLQCMKVKSESEVSQLCPTLSDPMDCSLPGSSIHGIFQARVL